MTGSTRPFSDRPALELAVADQSLARDARDQPRVAAARPTRACCSAAAADRPIGEMPATKRKNGPDRVFPTQPLDTVALVRGMPGH